MNGGKQVNSGWVGGLVTCIIAREESHEDPWGDAVGSIGQCMAVMATLAEKFLIVVIGGADFIEQLLSV